MKIDWLSWSPRQREIEARNRALAGFLFLAADGAALGLDRRLDWQKIEVADPSKCPLAQASGGTYATGMRLAGRSEDYAWAMTHGFHGGRGCSSNDLTEAWRWLLQPRSVTPAELATTPDGLRPLVEVAAGG
jgi:hypothetical protein